MNTIHPHNSNFLKKAVQSDCPSISPNAEIEHRINYYYRLQHSKQKIYSNSFAGFFGWIFSTQTLALKSGFIVLATILLMVKSPVIQNQGITPIDTCETKTMVADTNAIVKDTCFN